METQSNMEAKDNIDTQKRESWRLEALEVKKLWEVTLIV